MKINPTHVEKSLNFEDRLLMLGYRYSCSETDNRKQILKAISELAKEDPLLFKQRTNKLCRQKDIYYVSGGYLEDGIQLAPQGIDRVEQMLRLKGKQKDVGDDQYTAPKNSNILDHDIALNVTSNSKGELFLCKKNNGAYQYYRKLSPTAAWIIRYFFDRISSEKKEFSRRELVDACLHCKVVGTISNAISSINKLCIDNGVKELLCSTPDSKWRLNSELSCWEHIQSSK